MLPLLTTPLCSAKTGSPHMHCRNSHRPDSSIAYSLTPSTIIENSHRHIALLYHYALSLLADSLAFLMPSRRPPESNFLVGDPEPPILSPGANKGLPRSPSTQSFHLAMASR